MIRYFNITSEEVTWLQTRHVKYDILIVDVIIYMLLQLKFYFYDLFKDNKEFSKY